MGKRGFFAAGSVTGLAEMEIHDIGSGPAVLCLHDAAAEAAAFVPLVARLRGRYRVIVPELPAVASVEIAAAMIEAALADRGVARLHAIVGAGTGAYRALHLAAWREVPVELLALLGGDVSCAELAAFGPAPNVKSVLSRLAAQVYVRVGEHGDRAAASAIAAATGARLDVVRGCGAGLLAGDEAATLAAVAAALDDIAALDVPPPRLSFRQPTG